MSNKAEHLSTTKETLDSRIDELREESKAVEKAWRSVMQGLYSYPPSLERDQAIADQLNKRKEEINTFRLELQETKEKYDIALLVEGNKMSYDWFKHLTTLSTGSVLLVATLFQTVFTNQLWSWLVGVALIFFLLAALGSALAMAGRVSNHTAPPDPTRSARDARLTPLKRLWGLWDRLTVDAGQDTLFFLILLFFVSGTTSFTIFAIRNLF